MPTQKYRFGVLRESLSDYRDLAELDEAIDHGEFPLVEERDEYTLRKGSRDPYYEPPESAYQEEFFYFRYVSETLRTGIGLDDDGEDIDREMAVRDTMDFILFPDGRFIYQSANDVGPGNAMEVLFGAIPESESDVAIPTTAIRDFYNDNTQIGRIKIGGFLAARY